MFFIRIAVGVDSNLDRLISEVTALPAVPKILAILV